MPSNQKRPMGLTAIAVLWFIWSIGNLFMISMYIYSDLSVLGTLKDPSLPEWVRIAIPVELVINCIGFVLILIILFTCYGLLTGKPWSYKIALRAVLFMFILNTFVVILYMSAPPELGLGGLKAFMRLPLGLVWISVLWIYLRKPHVKKYLGVGHPGE